MSKILQQAQLLQHQLQQEAETITHSFKTTCQHLQQNLQDDLESERQSYKNAIHQLVSSQITQFNDQLTGLTTQAFTQLQQQVHDQCRTELTQLAKTLTEHYHTQNQTTLQAHTQFQDQYLIQIEQQQHQLDSLIQAYQQNLSQIQPNSQTSSTQTSTCQTSVMLMWGLLAISLCILAALMTLIYHDQLWLSFLISLGVCVLLSLSLGGLMWYLKSPSHE